MDGNTHWRIGELAKTTGLTVRTLHHYDELGLLSPSGRTEAGHRLYSADEVRRLYAIVALRRLGLDLRSIAAAIEGAADLQEIVRRHVAEVEREIELQRDLTTRLYRVLDVLEAHADPSSTDVMEVIRIMSMHERYYTPEQLEKLEQRRQELGDEVIERSQQEWAELIAAVEKHRVAGTDPADPAVQALAERWQALIEAFTGGDPGIAASLKKMYDEQGPQQASQGMVAPETMEYAGRALAARNK